MPKVHAESEMEEGEIVDELDDLSDISSEEEFLLRQRLEVLENYNNVLERKKAKRSSMGPGTKQKRHILCDLSEVSATEMGDTHIHGSHKHITVQRHVKPHKDKRRKEAPYVDENNVRRKKDTQRKKNSRKKRSGAKVVETSDESEEEHRTKRKKQANAVIVHRGMDKPSLSSKLHTCSVSDESEDEYRNKRKKLADAVIVHRGVDKSSLSARLHKMIHWSDAHIQPVTYDKSTDNIVSNNHINLIEELSPISSVNADDPIIVDITETGSIEKNKETLEPIDISTDDEDVKIIEEVESQEKDNTVKLELKPDQKENEVQVTKDSDDDLELLRQHALKSKPMKSKSPEPKPETEQKPMSEDEDSDTTELRLICLKSALLKKAIEMKRKQKMQKKLSQSSNLEDDLLIDTLSPIEKDDNNTDTESVDMDMGSDTEEKIKDCNVENEKKSNVRLDDNHINNDLITCAIDNINSAAKEDELDDDEDLLRAKLLTSLSKNLTNLVSPEVLKTIDEVKIDNSTPQIASAKTSVPEAKKFIIKLDESDSEGEHEATKNLTKMHIKLSEQIDFQQKLDLFLKSTRLEVEKSKLPDVVQKPLAPKKPDKFVAKAVNHLPKSEQIEYKNLVRRMAELEKMKQTRQATLGLLNQQQSKDTLKQRNVTIDTQATINNVEEQIAKSRKTIAEESAKMLKLKEEATKLSQRYKIAATELRNIGTAINLNKKQQRAVHISLSKIRLHHQSLLKSSTTSLHSKVHGRIPHLSNLSNKVLSMKLQKENNPMDEYKNPHVQKAVKISVVNDFVDETSINHTRLSVQLDVSSNNKKVIKIPNPDTDNDKTAETNEKTENNEEQLEEQNVRLFGNDEQNNEKEKVKSTKDQELLTVCDHGDKRYISVDDYKSPLDALGSTTWQADPNAILCPFEVGGQCKDLDCKYLHTPTQTQ